MTFNAGMGASFCFLGNASVRPHVPLNLLTSMGQHLLKVAITKTPEQSVQLSITGISANPEKATWNSYSARPLSIS